MKQTEWDKPVPRSRLRLWFGFRYYEGRRYLKWAFGGIRFASVSAAPLPYECFAHRTPLFRKLKDVDMYLQYNKVVNLKLAIGKINYMTLRPGETFSYWRAIGKPTKRRGYLEGMVLENGSFKPGTGGGLCQLSNLIYWMTAHTPLTVVERHRHGFDVFPDADRTQPFGSGATCYYNYVDLMIRNDTDRVFQLALAVTDSDLVGAWLSDKPCDCRYEVYEKEHLMRHEYWGGYTRHNLLFRKVYDMAGNEVGDEYLAENHALMMYSPFLPETASVPQE
ncbi:MAG: VanW family protein [Clostridiales Family XIII bacterium]|jgi:vancomycin resistance protein VanW|nr:VanW family protein [Clostridiales Family XIII bacterium]